MKKLVVLMTLLMVFVLGTTVFAQGQFSNTPSLFPNVAPLMIPGYNYVPPVNGPFPCNQNGCGNVPGLFQIIGNVLTLPFCIIDSLF
jgi:hypothetical protein